MVLFLVIIVGVFYVMYGGIVILLEIVVVGVLMCLVIVMVIYKFWNLGDFWVVLCDSIKESVMILFIIVVVGVFFYMLFFLFII